MLHLFHGDNIEASRRELQNFRGKFKDSEVIVLDGRRVTFTELKQATESTSLFGADRLVVIENFLSKRLSPRPKDTDELIILIKNIPSSSELVFWEDKEIGKTIISFLPKNIDLAVFQYPRELFNFLDSIRPGKGAEIVERFGDVVTHDSAEMIFAMLIRQFRFLIMVKDLGKKVTELTPWQAAKFSRQAEGFTLKDLIDLYGQLLDIDIKIKSGTTPFNLTQEMKLFLINIKDEVS